MTPDQTFPPPEDFAAHAGLDGAALARMSEQAARDPDSFWRTVGERLHWFRPFTQVQDTSFDPADFRIRWYADGELNACYNCVDRHLPERADQVAILFEGDEPGTGGSMTYGELHREVCRMANVLKSLGVGRGDRVTLYLPMIPLACVAMLACARIGAVHSVVFGGFSPEALAGRIADCRSDFVITADEGRRGGRRVPLKANVDRALEIAPVSAVLMLRWTGAEVALTHGRDHVYEDLRDQVPADCPAEPMGAEDPLFILYTSGSTGKPKGVLHTTGGYLAWASFTHEIVFDWREGDIYWCTADVGWVTGHSYIVYGPLANGATTLVFEGVPTWPDASRCWQVVDRHKVTLFYTAPTAIRALMREGDDFVTRTSRSSLRLLGSVGEPINPEAWLWYHRVVGEGRCPIVDTWWQTETGGILISPVPGATTLKPGSATRPLPGILPAIVTPQGDILQGPAEGPLCITASWPGQMRTVYGDHQRFLDTYFSTFPGKYFTGDGARRDGDGYYWITGRIDDVLNVSGHRLGTAEIESALVSHPLVAEAAVVGYPHDIKGQGVWAYVTLVADSAPSEALRAELVGHVRAQIGPIASPDVIQWAPALPKTRSGKIMRRILRKIAEGDTGSLGDTSTLADPAVVDELIAARPA
ncbi:MAG: acetate--CoA ligase [Brevundimonas sp.]|uniref:acetate--CoA ligase n=1 Tax=Brevundimonas sp. TaxID=1871086 RepID=UPI00391B3371